MSLIPSLMRRVERAAPLDPVAEKTADVVRKALPERADDALHGVWLGHPIHPLLVQVPLGAWLSALVLDFSPGSHQDGARRLVGLGLAAAPAAIAAGWSDWLELEPEQRRVGLVHAASNTVGIGFLAWSYLARRRGGSGRLSALLGMAAAGAGGALGGHLAYAQAAGANHAEGALREAGTDWHDLGPLEDYVQDQPVARTVGSARVVAVRRGADLWVLADECTHVGAPLHEGKVVETSAGACIECPWHASRFALRDGAVQHGPATAAQPAFEVQYDHGHVMVRAHAEGSHWT